jgi:hypothetical protein
MKHSESIKAIAPAIVRAQAEIDVVVANADNPFFKSKYADLDACWRTLKEPLQRQGIALIQTLGFIPGAGPTLITTLLHLSGEYISGEQPVCAAKDDPQGMGSAITYARRYGLSAILALVQVDDDAEGAMKSGPKPQAGKRESTPPKLTAVADPGAYIMKMGKEYKDSRLDKIDIYKLDGFAQWLAKKDTDPDPTKRLDALGRETLAAIETFLKSREFKRSVSK